MRLIVNIPAFNEAEKIGETIKRIPRSFAGIDEVLVQVIDDGSKDNTARIAKEAGADFVISHPGNRGIGKTFRTSVENALENGADFMVNIDADGQFDPNDIEKLFRPVFDGKADLVTADRFSEHKAENIPFIKDFLNRFAAWIIGSFMNAPISDLTCGFRAYSRETLLRLNLPGAFTYTQEVIIDALGKDLKVLWIPVKVTYFADRKSRVVKSIGKYIKNSAKIIIKAVRDVRPLKFFGIPGLTLIIVAVVTFAVFLGFYFQDYKITPFRNYLLVAITLFLVGLQLLVFALVADMIRSNRRLTEDLMYQIKKEKYKK
jgi:glycosyltransferase involved in cell wall biosynthesis